MTEYLLVNEQTREFALIDDKICDQICKHVESDDIIYDLSIEEFLRLEDKQEKLTLLKKLKYTQITINDMQAVHRTLSLSRILY